MKPFETTLINKGNVCGWVFSAILMALTPSALLASPNSLTYQGRILKSDGTPLEYNNVSFIFQITDPTGACVIYEERVDSYNMANSGGIFDVPIGSGSVTWPLGGTFYVLAAFNNSTASFSCQGGSSYAPSVDDSRHMKVQFFDGSGWHLISPDNVIRSVPFAGYALSAQKLGNNVASDFLTKAGLPTCNTNEFLSWNSGALSCKSVSGTSGGTVTNVTVDSPLSVTNGTSAPHITLPAASNLQDGYLSASDWSVFNNKLSSSSTFSGDVSGTATTIRVDKIKSIAVSATAPTPNQVLQYDGTQWSPATLSSGAITSVTSINGDILVGGTATAPVLSLNSSTAGGTGNGDKIAKLDGSGLLSGSMIPNLSINKLTELGAMSDGQILVGKNSSVPQIVSMSGDVTLSNTGVTTIGKINNTAVSGVGLATNNVLQNTGAAIAANSVLVSNGTGSGVTALATPASGVLASSGTVPVWLSSLPETMGGTGHASYAVGDLLYASSTSALSRLPASTSGYVLTSNGAGTAPSWQVPGGDNLGNHTATQNLNLGSYKLVGNGGSSGIAINTLGNVGIGTATPQSKLQVNGDAIIGNGNSTIQSGNYVFGSGNSITNSGGGNAAAMSIIGSSNTIATSLMNFGYNLSLFGNSNTVNNNAGNAVVIGNSNTVSAMNTITIGTFLINNIASSLMIGNSDANKITMLANGNVGIGTSTPSYQLQLATDSAAKPGTSTWTIASDKRLKDIRAPFNRGLEALEGLHTIYFRYKQDNPLQLPSDKEYVGIIAQDAQKAVPESVQTDDQGYLHVTNDAIIWTAVNSIKELYHRMIDQFASQSREIAAVKAANAQLKLENDQLRQDNIEIKARLERIEKALQK